MITSVRLQHFRSYGDESFEFDPAVNIVVGPNASGKTNLLESVYVLCSGSSYKARDIDLIQQSHDWCRVEGFFGQQSRTVKLKAQEGRIQKDFEIGPTKFRRLSLERTEPVVLFDPSHLSLIFRGPEYRRDYFDDLLARTQPGFKKLAAGYGRTLSQRNSLLKKGRSVGKDQLFAWNIRLSEQGSQIAQARQALIESINNVISDTYSQIAQQKSKVNLDYKSQFRIDRYATSMNSKLEADTDIDYERGFTGHGPHREDIVFHLNDQPVSQSASRGENRSLVLGLKIFELKLIEQSQSTDAILLLDDVFSELDGLRRRRLVDFIGQHQVIITTTDADAALEYFTGSKIIAVQGGLMPS